MVPFPRKSPELDSSHKTGKIVDTVPFYSSHKNFSFGSDSLITDFHLVSFWDHSRTSRRCLYFLYDPAPPSCFF